MREDAELEREVAIASSAGSRAMRPGVRYQREVRAMARLGDHPNVVSVYDVGTEDGKTYIVAQYVRGGRSRPEPDARRAAGWAWRARSRWRATSRRRWPTRTRAAWSTATSSRATCCWARTTSRCSPTSASAHTLEDLRLTAEHAHVGTVPTCRPSRRAARPADGAATSTRSARCCSSCCAASCRSPGRTRGRSSPSARRRSGPSVAARDPAIAPQLDALVAQLMAVERGRAPAVSSGAAGPWTSSRPDGPAGGAGAARRPLVESVRLPPALAGGRQAPFVGRAEPLAQLP